MRPSGPGKSALRAGTAIGVAAVEAGTANAAGGTRS